MEIGIRLVSNIDNTPGVWYAIAYFLSALLFLHFNHNTRKGLAKWIPIGVLGVFLAIFMHVTSGCYGVLYVVVMLVVVTCIYLIFNHALEGDFNKKAYYTVRAFMLGEMMASIGWQIFYYGINTMHVSTDYFHQTLSMVPTYLLIILIAVFFEKRHERRNRDLIIGRKELVIVFLAMFVLYSISNLSYVVTGTPFTTEHASELFIIRTIIDFTAVVSLYLYHELLQQTVEKVEAETLKNMLQMQYSQYQIQEESMALVNQKYHDLKHQILALKANPFNENNTEYLDQMLSDIKRYETSYATGNRVLDTMLSAKAMNCQARGIELTCVADGSVLEFMNPMDVSALFGNALDNAIESAEQIPNKEERLIHLTVDRQKGFARIYVENRYIGKIKFRHGLPVTTKSDVNLHGYGSRSMKSIAEKYGGSIQATAEDGWFKLSILIPCI